MLALMIAVLGTDRRGISLVIYIGPLFGGAKRGQCLSCFIIGVIAWRFLNYDGIMARVDT